MPLFSRSSSESGPALPPATDRTGRRVPSEPPYTSTTYARPETHRITPSGSVPRSGTPAPTNC